MTDEMKLKIAKLRADGYKVNVIINHNTDKWDKYIKQYKASLVAAAWCGAAIGNPKHPSAFYTTDFEIVKE
jgi:hypothetical protein